MPRRAEEFDLARIQRAVLDILEAVGEDPQREGLVDTPRRVAEAYQELFSGLGRDPADELSVFFETDHDEVVLVKDIPFYSMCEHHLLPFHGRAHVAYLPRNGRITGLSKLARAVEVASRRPQLQERLTVQIADAIEERLNPRGVVVVIEAEHLCMTMRGIQKPGSYAVTSAVRGLFRENVASRHEVFALIRSDLRP